MPSDHADISYTIPGMSKQDSQNIIELLQMRLHSLNDLHLTLKHVHWNVTGPNFISVHEMLDEFVAKVRPMGDALAERIRTLGGVAVGTPQAIVDIRHWKDYDLGEGDAIAHLRSLRSVFQGVIEDHRAAIDGAIDSEADAAARDVANDGVDRVGRVHAQAHASCPVRRKALVASPVLDGRPVRADQSPE